MSAEYPFQTQIQVRFNETDLQGHVNFGHYLFYFDVGLTGYLSAIGYDYRRILEEGADLLFVESHCNYKARAYWPEVLEIHARIGHLGNRSLRFEFMVRAKEDQRLVATGHIVAVTARRGTFAPCPIPDSLRQAILAFEPALRQSG